MSLQYGDDRYVVREAVVDTKRWKWCRLMYSVKKMLEK